MSTQAEIDAQRHEVEERLTTLTGMVRESCSNPAQHKPVQHRDRQPPWCPYCGRTFDGRLVGGTRPGA